MSELLARLQEAIGVQYRIDRELGGGGMSRVFLAEEVELGRQVVVKVLPPEMGAGVNIERFRREILLAASLQHPHIVPLLSAGASGDLLYYVMPYIDGESLRQKLEREGELPVGEVVRILREVVDALEYAHSRGIVHRDIKPENIMLARKHALVTDFGVAKAVAESGASSLTSMGVALGTPAYMAPEQASADPHTDHRADIYAVGVMAYEMLCGRPPFVGSNPQSVLAAHVTQSPDPIHIHRQTVPEGLQQIIMRCLEKRAADRWQTAEDLSPQLEAYGVTSGGITPTGTRPTEAVAARTAHPMRIALLFGLASAAVLALVFLAIRLIGLPDWVLLGAAVLLAIGLPIMLLTGHVERGRDTLSTSSAARRGWQGWFTWRRAMLGGVVAFAALALGVGGYMVMRSMGVGPVGTLMATGAIGDQDRLVLADFANRTSDASLGRSVTEALRIDLSQSPVVRLLDPGDIAAALERMEKSTDTPVDVSLAREIARREGAKAIVTGEIGPVGNGYVLSGTILSTADGSVLTAQRETAADPGQLIAAIDRLSGKLRERIGESLKSIRDAEALERVSTASMEALERYTEAIRIEQAGDMSRAAEVLREAVALDTGFAMAWRKLAVVLNNSNGNADQAIQAATQAYRNRDRLPDTERYMAEAYYYSAVEYDPARQEATYRSLLARDPGNHAALNNLSLVLQAQGRTAEAESLLVKAVEHDTHWTSYGNLMGIQATDGRFEQAQSTVEQFAGKVGESPQLTRMRMWLAGFREDFDSVEIYARRLADRDDPIWKLFGNRALEAGAATRGRTRDAMMALRQGQLVAEARGSPETALLTALEMGRLELQYRDATEAALDTVASALRRYPLDSMAAVQRPYAGIARFYISVGDTTRARSYLDEYSRTVPEGVRRGDGELQSALGDLAIARGDYDGAVTYYRAGNAILDCVACATADVARAFDLAGQPDSAVAVLETEVEKHPYRFYKERLSRAPSLRRLGEYYETRDRQKALDYYGHFVKLWREADPELQPQVQEVKERMARLAGE